MTDCPTRPSRLFQKLKATGMLRALTFESLLGGQSLGLGLDHRDRGPRQRRTPRSVRGGGHVQTTRVELYTGRSSRQPNRVFRNFGNGTFQDVSREYESGLPAGGAAPRRRPWRPRRRRTYFDAVSDAAERSRSRSSTTRRSPAGTSCCSSFGHGHGPGRPRDVGPARARLRTLAGGHATTAVGYGGSRDKRIHFGSSAGRRRSRARDHVAGWTAPGARGRRDRSACWRSARRRLAEGFRWGRRKGASLAAGPPGTAKKLNRTLPVEAQRDLPLPGRAIPRARHLPEHVAADARVRQLEVVPVEQVQHSNRNCARTGPTVKRFMIPRSSYMAGRRTQLLPLPAAGAELAVAGFENAAGSK